MSRMILAIDRRNGHITHMPARSVVNNCVEYPSERLIGKLNQLRDGEYTYVENFIVVGSAGGVNQVDLGDRLRSTTLPKE